MVSGCATQTFSSCSPTGRDIYILNGDEASGSLVSYSSFFFHLKGNGSQNGCVEEGERKKI